MTNVKSFNRLKLITLATELGKLKLYEIHLDIAQPKQQILTFNIEVICLMLEFI